MNKFKKKTRSKMIAASIAILSSAAVVSTGFAAWVISGGDNKQAGGTIKADLVSSSLHTITGLTATQTITYGGLAEANQDKTITKDDVWLENDGLETLLAAFSFKVENVQSEDLDKPTNVFKTITLTETNPTATTSYTAMATSGYVATLDSYKMETIIYTEKQPDLYNTDHTSHTGMYLVKGNAEEKATTTINFTLYIVFGWGTNFGSMNPWNFYNSQKNVSKENKDSAQTALNTLHNMDATLQVKIETK